MHGHVPYDQFLSGIAGFLGSYYILMAVMNGVAAFLLWRAPNQRTLVRLPGLDFPITGAFVLLLASIFFTLVSALAYSGSPDVMQFISVPVALRALINRY